MSESAMPMTQVVGGIEAGFDGIPITRDGAYQSVVLVPDRTYRLSFRLTIEPITHVVYVAYDDAVDPHRNTRLDVMLHKDEQAQITITPAGRGKLRIGWLGLGWGEIDIKTPS